MYNDPKFSVSNGVPIMEAERYLNNVQYIPITPSDVWPYSEGIPMVRLEEYWEGFRSKPGWVVLNHDPDMLWSPYSLKSELISNGVTAEGVLPFRLRLPEGSAIIHPDWVQAHWRTFRTIVRWRIREMNNGPLVVGDGVLPA